MKRESIELNTLLKTRLTNLLYQTFLLLGCSQSDKDITVQALGNIAWRYPTQREIYHRISGRIEKLI